MNESAFPTGAQDVWAPKSGMTLRDYFIAAVIQGLMANPNVIGFNERCGWDYVNCTADVVTGFASAQVDSLMSARESQEAPHTPTETQ